MTCCVCEESKGPAEFYGNGRSLCRACNRERVKRWAALNPRKVRRNRKKYLESEKGAAKHRKRMAVWRPLNTAAERARHQRYVERMPDAYIRKLLRCGMFVPDPTPEQIVDHRNRLSVMRAQRTFKIIAYGSKLKN